MGFNSGFKGLIKQPLENVIYTSHKLQFEPHREQYAFQSCNMEMAVVYFENHAEQVNKLYGKRGIFFRFKPEGTYTKP